MESDAAAGRVLLASLHQAIEDVLPGRLGFYERWLTPAELSRPTIGVLSLMGLLDFLEHEGAAASLVKKRAGHYAAIRSFEELPSIGRAFLRILPRRLRARRALRLIIRILLRLYDGSRATVTRRGSTVFVDLQGSPFCTSRGRTISNRAACGFYASAIVTFLQLFDLHAAARISRCQASGAKECLLVVLADGAHMAPGPERTMPRMLPEATATGPTLAPRPEPPVSVPASEMRDPATDVGAPVIKVGVPAPAASGAPRGAGVEDTVIRIFVPTDRMQIEARWDAIPMIPPPAQARTEGSQSRDTARSAIVVDKAQDPEAPWHNL